MPHTQVHYLCDSLYLKAEECWKHDGQKAADTPTDTIMPQSDARGGSSSTLVEGFYRLRRTSTATNQVMLNHAAPCTSTSPPGISHPPPSPPVHLSVQREGQHPLARVRGVLHQPKTVPLHVYTVPDRLCLLCLLYDGWGSTRSHSRCARRSRP